MFTWSMIGVRDHLAYNRALWTAVSRLHERGVKDSDIDGGYMVNGWLQYSHPQNAKQGKDGGVIVNWVTTANNDAPYQISSRPLKERRTVDVIQYQRWLGRSRAIYILQDETNWKPTNLNSPATPSSRSSPDRIPNSEFKILNSQAP